MTTEHFLYAPADVAQRVAERAVALGLVVASLDAHDGGARVVVVGDDACRVEDADQLSAVAAELGCEYDGWGAYVGPLEVLGGG